MTAVRLPAAERRRQLLEVALSKFSTTGFHETSMNDLAAAAGVTKPVLYQHFPSKNALYLELVADVSSRLIETIRSGATSIDDPRGQIVNGLRAYFAFMSEQRRAFALLFGRGAPRDRELVAAVRDAEAAVVEAIAELMSSDVAEPRRSALAHAIVGMAEGVARHWATTGRHDRLDELAEQTGALLWNGLGSIVEVPVRASSPLR
ncbi:MAG: TetR/AcrR family transcriptional regulator [Actinomycetota bacterium]